MRSFETDEALCDTPELDTDELTRATEREVEQAAFGQVASLSVARLGDAIVLRGHCRTYHARQLALQAAMDVIAGSARIIDLITVH